MPLTLRLHETPLPRFVERASRVPAWRLLHQQADVLYPALAALWLRLFLDMRRNVDVAALRRALARGALLEAGLLLRQAWMTFGERPAQRLLMPLLREAQAQTVAVLVPDAAFLVPLTPAQRQGLEAGAAVLASAETYARGQIGRIEERTLAATRQILRQGAQDGLSLAQQVTQVQQAIGLTPRQVQTLGTVRVRLTDRGESAARIRQAMVTTAARALRRRVEVIARTQSIDTASAAQYSLWQAMRQQGIIDTTYKRFWIVTPDDRLCPVCAAIPGLNPDGVGFDEPFQTPVGPVLHPTVHAQCRCAVTLRRTV